VLATSPAFRKTFVEKLWTKWIETTTAAPPLAATPLHETFKLTTTRQAAFSLPLREVEVLVNDIATKHAILDQGSQIVVIRADVAHACGAHINLVKRPLLRMAGTIPSLLFIYLFFGLTHHPTVILSL